MRAFLPSAWRRRVAASLSVTGASALALATLTSLPAGAQSLGTTAAQDCPVLQLGNPNPGDLLPPGGYIVSGFAFDPAGPQGVGIQRIELFLGPRDAGGQILGTATAVDHPLDPSHAFQIEVMIPQVQRSQDFVAYAYSAITSAQTSVTVPVNIGAVPLPTPHTTAGALSAQMPTETVQMQCAPLPAGAPANTTTAAATPMAVSAPQPAATVSPLAPAVTTGQQASRTPILQLANPSPGDLLTAGGYVVSGIAYDPASPQGQSGVDRVDLFLDDRDQGGEPLGSATPGQNMTNPRAFETEVQIPNHLNGAHTFFAYAHSSLTNLESVTSVTVFLGTPPTPTPRPS
jgi:hypothetical protein